MGAPIERLVPMPDCDHREICRHGDRTSNYKKLLNAVEDAIPLPQPIAQNLQGAVSVLKYAGAATTLLGYVKTFKQSVAYHVRCTTLTFMQRFLLQ